MVETKLEYPEPARKQHVSGVVEMQVTIAEDGSVQNPRVLSGDPLLTAGLARDFEQLRIEFLGRCRGADVDDGVEQWIVDHGDRIDQFRKLVGRARSEGHVSAPMLAQIAGQARILLGR